MIKKILHFENKRQPLLAKRLFYRRLFNHLLTGILVIILSLGFGVLGYHYLENFSWIDSLLNASMILGGMGPVGELHTFGGKLFASLYALFSGIVFLVTVGIIIAPAVHRFLHKLHLSETDDE